MRCLKLILVLIIVGNVQSAVAGIRCIEQKKAQIIAKREYHKCLQEFEYSYKRKRGSQLTPVQPGSCNTKIQQFETAVVNLGNCNK